MLWGVGESSRVNKHRLEWEGIKLHEKIKCQADGEIVELGNPHKTCLKLNVQARRQLEDSERGGEMKRQSGGKRIK